MTIVCMPQTVAGSGLKCQDFCGRRGFEERQDGIGANSDRENENLSVIDRGIVMFREMLFQAMADVEQGQDPLGVVRDVAKNDSIRVNATEELLDATAYRSAKSKYTVA